MKNKIKIYSILFLGVISLCSMSFATMKKDTHYHPVIEIQTDELPESIMDLKFMHSISRLPVVFRGAAKHWEAINWTPESLESRGLHCITDTMKSKKGTRDVYGYNDKIKEIFKDMHYHETDYKNTDQVDKRLLKENIDYDLDFHLKIGSKFYSYLILAGSKGFTQDFHQHVGALLAEFYGQRVVFLADPYTSSEEIDSETEHTDGLFTECTLAEQKEPLFKIKSNNYHPFQKVVLNPGDVLYIPANWWHKVTYATPCLGATQLLSLNRYKNR